MRRIRYREIADAIRDRIGGSPVGTVLESEAALSHEFGVSRVTIRNALEVLREEGIIAARQGFGWYVTGDPVRQSLDVLSTIEAEIEDGGQQSERKISEFAFEPAPPRVREALGADQVLRVKRINLADGVPFATVTVWCPADLAVDLSRRDVERRPFYELLDVELHGATQTIGADVADAAEADLLRIPVGAPLLRCRRLTTDRGGRPVLLSEHVFPAHRTEFVVELPHAGPSITPSGLRLVDGTP